MTFPWDPRTPAIHLALSAVLWLVAGPLPAAAADENPAAVPGSPRTLYLSLEHSELSVGGDGGRLAIDWLQPVGSATSLVAGLSASQVGDSDWQVGRLGFLTRAGDDLTVWGDLYAGAGVRDGQDFDYGLVLAGLSWELVEGRLYLDLEDRYLDIDTVYGNLAQVALTHVAGSRLSTRLAYLRSTSGNVESEFVTGRVDLFTRQQIHWLGGLAGGRTRAEVVEMIGGEASELRQAFVGLGFPLRDTELTLIFDYLELDDTERGAVSLTLRVPLSSPGRRPDVP